ncbi:hypothetical protein, partial [Mycobacterium palustre]|uniref:hypothetical protein n=1 Tax=Mycobacterium palustre TaxID=153971 RepID=UPI0021F258EC
PAGGAAGRPRRAGSVTRRDGGCAPVSRGEDRRARRSQPGRPARGPRKSQEAKAIRQPPR